MRFKKYSGRTIRHIVSMPFIYGMIVPLIALDIAMEVYHRVCFQLYSISYIKRSSYIRIDRHKLSYLSFFEKLHCAYCGYANGLLGYAVAIAAETEKYWCGIMHQKVQGFLVPAHHEKFVAYGDVEGYRRLTTHKSEESL